MVKVENKSFVGHNYAPINWAENPPIDIKLSITRFQMREYTIWTVSNASPRIARAGNIVKENRAMMIAPTYPIAVAVV